MDYLATKFPQQEGTFQSRRPLASLVIVVMALALTLGVFVAPHTALAASGQAPWWNGRDCNGDGNAQLITTDPTLGLQVCYPKGYNGSQPDSPEAVPGASATLAEWECVELSGRYLAQYQNMPDKGPTGGGKAVAQAYYNWYHSTRSDISMIYSNDSGNGHSTTVGTFPSVGDIFSTASGNSSNGHTGVISSVTITNASAGDGVAMLLEQNVGGGWNGWNPDGTLRSSPWPDNAGPYTKLQITNWNYYDDDFSTPPLESNVEILHFNGSGGTATNPVYSNHAEYVIGSDHHLYTYLYQPSTNWTKQDISGTTATLQGSVTSYLINGCHFAFAIDTSGHLHEYYRCSLSGSWTHSDLSNTLGVTFAGSPEGYAFNDPSTHAVHHSLNLVGTDGNYYNVSYTPATNWQKTLVSAAATFTGTPSGYAVVGSSYFELVYLVASNGALYEFIHNGSGWASQNVFSSLAAGVTAINSPSAYSYLDSSGNTDHSVFVLGSNHHLYNLVYRPSTNWQTYDVSGSAITYNYSPSGHFSYQGGGLHFVYAVSSTGTLEEYYSAEGTNTWAHVGLGTGASELDGSPASYSYLGSASAANTTHIIFFPETDGHLHEANYTTSWNYLDLGLPATGVTIQSDADGYGF